MLSNGALGEMTERAKISGIILLAVVLVGGIILTMNLPGIHWAWATVGLIVGFGAFCAPADSGKRLIFSVIAALLIVSAIARYTS